MPTTALIIDEATPLTEAQVEAATTAFTLLPEARPMTEVDYVATGFCRVAPGTPAPGADLVASVRALGVLQPIAVRAGAANGGYEVVAGARRVLAARQIDLRSIPALVFPQGTPDHVIAAATLSENTLRRANPLRELEAIEAMMAAGADETTIARELHIPRQVVQARLRLGRLIPELRTALINGEMGAAVAGLAARLDATRQQALAATLAARRDRGDRATLTASDVRATLRVQRGAHVDALPDAVFTSAATAVPVVDEASPVREAFAAMIADRDRLHTALAAMTAERDALRDAPAPVAPVVEGVAGMLALAEQILDLAPVEPNGESERRYAVVEAFVEQVRRWAAPAPTARATAPVAPVAAPVAQVVAGSMTVRGMARFGETQDGRFFERFLDGQGVMRRRYDTEANITRARREAYTLAGMAVGR